jgi:hypothetical protein
MGLPVGIKLLWRFQALLQEATQEPEPETLFLKLPGECRTSAERFFKNRISIHLIV